MNLRPFVRFLAVALVTVASAARGADGPHERLPRNWPMPPSELERRFATQDFVVLDVQSTGGGVTGASKLKVRFPDGAELWVKWKPVPGGSADGSNNSPRKELAAYEVQRWLVDEKDFLVPTLAPHCLSFDKYRPIDTDPAPSLKGSKCVLGVVAVWLQDVTAPGTLWDPERFERDPAYARSMADFNVLTWLIEHKDGRRGNLLLSTDPADPRVFAVDNGIAFDPFPWNFFVANWNRIRVSWVRRETIERLRKVDRKTIERLGVVAELEMRPDGVYEVVPPGPNMDDDDGVRRRGDRVQFGLTDDEIEDVEERLESLLKKVDSGKIAVR
jgi:hypothetical protein